MFTTPSEAYQLTMHKYATYRKSLYNNAFGPVFILQICITDKLLATGKHVWSVALSTNDKVLIAQRIYVMYNIQTEYCCSYEMKNW